MKEQNKRINYTKFGSNGSGNHFYSSTIFLILEIFAQSIYNGNLPVKAAKLKKEIWSI